MNKAVFISYPSQNVEAAKQACDFLEQRGIKCWMAPRDVPPGMEYAEALVDAINDCQLLLLVFSLHANRSGQVKREVERAVSKGKVIMPIKLDEVMPSKSMEFYISNTHWLDACTPPLESHLERLYQSIRSFIAINRTSVFRSEAENAATRDEPGLVKPQHASRSINVRVAQGRRENDGAVDKAFMDGLQVGARQIVECARALAGRCRAPEITHRLLMAAFLTETKGCAASVCRVAGVDPLLLWALLVAMSHQPSKAGQENAVKLRLGTDSCGRVLLPTLTRARELAADPGRVSERDLFNGFCEQADPTFMEFLKMPAEDETAESVEVDLAGLRHIDPEHPGLLDRLTLRARTVVQTALRLAQQRQVTPIPNRLMLAAFLNDQNRLAHRLMTLAGLNVQNLCAALIHSAGGKADVELQLNEFNCSRIVAPTIRCARDLAGASALVTERLLFRAFCKVAEPLMKVELKKAGVDLDRFGGISEEAHRAPVVPPSQDFPRIDPRKIGLN